MKAVLTIALSAALLPVQPLRPQSFAAPDNDPVHQQGRSIFSAKCGKCHDENARKKLSDGSTLLSRLAASKDRKALLGTRLKSMSAEDRQAVSLYVEGLLSQYQSSQQK